jgi:hypothetical protein
MSQLSTIIEQAFEDRANLVQQIVLLKFVMLLSKRLRV